MVPCLIGVHALIPQAGKTPSKHVVHFVKHERTDDTDHVPNFQQNTYFCHRGYWVNDRYGRGQYGPSRRPSSDSINGWRATRKLEDEHSSRLQRVKGKLRGLVKTACGNAGT